MAHLQMIFPLKRPFIVDCPVRYSHNQMVTSWFAQLIFQFRKPILFEGEVNAPLIAVDKTGVVEDQWVIPMKNHEYPYFGESYILVNTIYTVLYCTVYIYIHSVVYFWEEMKFTGAFLATCLDAICNFKCDCRCTCRCNLLNFTIPLSLAG